MALETTSIVGWVGSPDREPGMGKGWEAEERNRAFKEVEEGAFPRVWPVLQKVGLKTRAERLTHCFAQRLFPNENWRPGGSYTDVPRFMALRLLFFFF